MAPRNLERPPQSGVARLADTAAAGAATPKDAESPPGAVTHASPVVLHGQPTALGLFRQGSKEDGRQGPQEKGRADLVRRPPLAQLKHELRSPLSALIGYSEMLLEDARDLGDVDLMAELQGLHALAKRVLLLVSSLLDPTAVTLRQMDVARLREELQTPLDGMMNHCERLQEALRDRREAIYNPDLQKVQAAALKILALVDDLVRLSQSDLNVAAAEPTDGAAPPVLLRKGLAAARAPTPRSLQATSTVRLLLVDGNEINREMLQHRLQRKGYAIDVARSGQEALERIDAGPYDLVLLDFASPGLGGLDLLRAVRDRQSPLELPIIMLMAKDDTDDIVESLNLGANDYLTHPIDFPVALARVRTQLSLRRVTRQLEEANDRLKRYSYLDALTAIANRRRFDEFLAEEWRRSARSGTPLSLILLDIDDFKNYNDSYGHGAGDEVLRQVARTLAANVHRSEDLVARYGGEEFAVVLPNVAHEGAVVVAERLRAAVADLRLFHGQGAGRTLTVSGGVTTAQPMWNSTAAQALRLADAALYEAKRSGRNCVRVAPPP